MTTINKITLPKTTHSIISDFIVGFAGVLGISDFNNLNKSSASVSLRFLPYSIYIHYHT